MKYVHAIACGLHIAFALLILITGIGSYAFMFFNIVMAIYNFAIIKSNTK